MKCTTDQALSEILRRSGRITERRNRRAFRIYATASGVLLAASIALITLLPGWTKTEAERTNALVSILNGYFDKGAHHLNVNVFGTDKLVDAMEHPEKPEYANFTIRVSGYAVKFIDLTREQQLDVIRRTCHASL